MAHYNYLLAFLLWPPYVICTSAPYGCGPGVKTAGYTYPLGDITLKRGENLDILCVLNEAAIARYGPNGSEHMKYYLGNRNFSSEIVNSTAIRLHIKDHPETAFSDYYCMVDQALVCHNVVAVGTPPQDVTDFDCIGSNYENFTCSWTTPENYVMTHYSMSYAPALRPASFSSGCPDETITKNGNKTTMSCTWTMASQPQYRHAHDNFIFKLSANNTFGEKTWKFSIQQYTRVRPSPPETLVGLATSPNSIKLEWTIPLYIQTFPKPLNYRVSWWIEQNKKWTTVVLENPNVTDFKVLYELRDLPYAHCLYDIRVSMKSSEATEERMWSKNSSITVWTSSKIPDCPPNTTAGSFEMSEGTRIHLVRWQNIFNYQENGENLSYFIQIDGNPNIQPLKVYSNYATFENLPDKNFTFKIWSRNSVGNSADYSVVFFPAQRYTLAQVSKLVKVDKGNGEYDLEWTESGDSRVTNYTLFWCAAQKERPHPCEGTLQWKTVPRGVKNKTLRLATRNEKNEPINIYQFAISSNGYGTSSGMLWAHCTVIPGTGVKLRNTHVNKVGPRYIVLHWKFECIKLGNIQGFNVSYCTIAMPESQECQPDSQKYQLFNSSSFGMGEGELHIANLKPYTGYKIQVKPIVIGAESEFSDPMFNTTWEDTPTLPRDLRVIERTDRSLLIQWEKPLEENGHITNYVILVNGREEITVTAEKNKSIYKKELYGLLPRTNYTIQVKACTTTCSETSINMSTNIGYPGATSMPSANWNNSDLNVKWDKPDESGVKVDYYEVQFSPIKGGKEYYTQNTTDPSYTITLCNQNKSQIVYVKVRAVNIKDDQPLFGAWSQEGVFPCAQRSTSSPWIIPIIIMAVIVFLALMFYLTKKIWRKVVGMRNCPVKLPPGLDAVVNNFEPKEKHVDETLPGEPLLPDKFSTKSTNPSGESSGCCSGTESVSSSVETAGHLSGSDSGTEQPISSSLADTEHKDVSLRQRPNVKKTDYVTMNEIPQYPWSTKPTQSGYSVIGLSTPPKKSDNETEYMPLSDISAKPSYVPFPLTQSQDPVKEPPARASSSGYVPYIPQETAPKNTTYVLAGEPAPAKPAMKLTSKTAAYPPKESVSSGYVTAPPIAPPKTLFSWQQQACVEPPSTGYVVVGDTKPQNSDLVVQKGPSKDYVPHIKFETTKSLKED